MNSEFVLPCNVGSSRFLFPRTTPNLGNFRPNCCFVVAFKSCAKSSMFFLEDFTLGLLLDFSPTLTHS